MFRKYLNGGALYLAIFISLVISILLSMLMLHGYYSNLEVHKFLVRQSVHDNLYSAFNYASSPNVECTEEPVVMDLFEKETDSVKIVKRWWGCYHVIGIKSGRKGYSESLLCLVGTASLKDTALLITENNKPVSVAGKTELKGTCFIPKAGIKAAHIEGETFWGDKFIDGTQMAAPNDLPELNPDLYTQFEKATSSGASDTLISFDNLPDADTIKNSFLEKTLRIVSPGNLVLDGIRFSGNIILQASNRIIVNKSCMLNNVLLIAPVIEIKDEFSGTLQALASDSILTGDEVTLNYPSSLVLINKPVIDTSKKTISIPAVIVGEKCKVGGTILACIKNGNFTNSIYLKIKKESEIKGLIYSSGFLDMQGSLYGSAFAKSLILNTPSGVYDQHLLNAVIDRTKLSDFFVSGILFKGKNANKVAKWLN